MAISGTMAAMFKKNKCIVCDGELEKSNIGIMCYACKDRMRGVHRIPEEGRTSVKYKKTRGV